MVGGSPQPPPHTLELIMGPKVSQGSKPPLKWCLKVSWGSKFHPKGSQRPLRAQNPAPNGAESLLGYQKRKLGCELLHPNGIKGILGSKIPPQWCLKVLGFKIPPK